MVRMDDVMDQAGGESFQMGECKIWKAARRNEESQS